jgi:hypothetical protein
VNDPSPGRFLLRLRCLVITPDGPHHRCKSPPASHRERTRFSALPTTALHRRQLAKRVQLVDGAMAPLDHPWNDIVTPVRTRLARE